MDTKRWEIYPTLHTDDVVSETWDGLPGNDNWTPTAGSKNRVVGKEPLTRAIRSLLDGGTTVTETVHIEVPRPLAPFTARQAESAHKAMLAAIRRHFEESSGWR